jgi:hypothetical protein
MLTSREASADLGLLSGSSVRSLEVRGLSVADTQVLLLDKQLTGTELDWADFVTRCGGNALVLKMTGETVRQIFGSEISGFSLAVGSNGAIHGGVRRLLASQLDQRLSEVEREVVRLLAVSYEPLSPARITSAALIHPQRDPSADGDPTSSKFRCARRLRNIKPGDHIDYHPQSINQTIHDRHQ